MKRFSKLLLKENLKITLSQDYYRERDILNEKYHDKLYKALEKILTSYIKYKGDFEDDEIELNLDYLNTNELSEFLQSLECYDWITKYVSYGAVKKINKI